MYFREWERLLFLYQYGGERGGKSIPLVESDGATQLGRSWGGMGDECGFRCGGPPKFIFLYKYRRYMMDIMHTVKLFIAAGIMGAVAYGVYTGLYGIIHSNTLSTLAAIGASGIVYCIAVVMLRAVKGEDVASIPKIGGKMAALIDRCSIVKK